MRFNGAMTQARAFPSNSANTWSWRSMRITPRGSHER